MSLPLRVLSIPVFVAALAAQQPEPSRLHADVQDLLAFELRDAALTRILTRGVYRGPGDYTEKVLQQPQIRHVVVCPQPAGLPMFAVFLPTVGRRETKHVAYGHLITVAADGAVVRVWRGANVVDEHEVFHDINGDGVVERVGMMNCAVQDGAIVRELFVLALTARVEAPLRVAFDWRPDRGMDWQSTFRVVPAEGDQPARVQIGPVDRDSGLPKQVVAEWRWHAERKAWVGPGGGPDQSFVRLPPEGWAGLEEFAAAQRERDR